MGIFRTIMEHGGGPAIVIFIGVLISAGGALWASANRANYEKMLREKSDEIAGLNKYIARAITGGDSYPVLMPMFAEKDPDVMTISIGNMGKYPLYDIGARIVDLDVFEKKTYKGLSEITQDEHHLNIGNVAPSQARTFGNIKLQGKRIRWNIFFGARNGFFTETLRLAKVEGQWRIALKVDDAPTKEEVTTFHERIDEKFPRNKDGDIDW